MGRKSTGCVYTEQVVMYVFIQLTVPLFGEVAFTVTSVHSHSAEPAKYLARKLASDMTVAAENTNDSTRNIIRDGVQNIGTHLAVALPSRQ